MKLASFKLRFRDRHVRVLPAEVEPGIAFRDPGVDLRGPAADEALEAAAPLLAWIRDRDPASVVRSISVDLASLRIIVSLEDVHGAADGKPNVLRIDAPTSGDLLAMAAALNPLLSRRAAEAIARRG